MKKTSIEDLLSDLKPLEMSEEGKKSISDRLSRLEPSSQTQQHSEPILFRRIAVLKAAAIFILLAGTGILMRQVCTQPGSASSDIQPMNSQPAESISTAAQDAPAVDPDSLVPMSIKTHLLSESDEGIIMTPQGPMRVLKYQLRDDYELPGPRSNRVIRSMPREHVVLTSVSSN